MGRFYLSKEEAEVLKERIKEVVIRNGGAIIRKQIKARFPRASNKLLQIINKELRNDPRLPRWNGFPRSPYLETDDMRAHTETREEVTSRLKKKFWAEVLADRAERGSKSGRELWLSIK